MQIRRLPRTLAAVAVLIAALAGYHSAQASSLLTITVLVPPSVPAGFDAPVIIRAEGDQPELASLDYEANGGQITGVVSLNTIAPGVAEGTVYLRRDVPGDASVTVKSQGAVAARGTVRFAAYGQITVTATLAAEAHASARTWRFDVVDSSGAVVDSLSPGTSGDSPTGTATSAWLPYGSYTVRQVFGNDTLPSCSAGVFYAISSPTGGTTAVVLSGSSASAAFELRPCADAPTSLGVSITIDLIPLGVPVDEVLGARQAGPPRPPATGNGPASHGSTNPFLFVAAFMLAFPAVLAGSRVAARVRNQ